MQDNPDRPEPRSDLTDYRSGDWGWNIRQLRELAGCTQQAVATGAGIGRITVARLERDVRDEAATNSIRLLVALYRFFWQCGKLSFDDQQARRVTLADVLHVPGLARPASWQVTPPTVVPPIRDLPGVWWNIRPLRLEYNAHPAHTRLSMKALGMALGQTQQNVGLVEGNGGVGSVPLLVHAARYFARELRPDITLHDVLIVLPRPTVM